MASLTLEWNEMESLKVTAHAKPQGDPAVKFLSWYMKLKYTSIMVCIFLISTQLDKTRRF